MKKTVFDLTYKEGKKIGKEMRKTSYYKQYQLGYSIYALMLILIAFITMFSDSIDIDIKEIYYVIFFGFLAIMSLLFWFKQFDLFKKYYEEKYNKEEK